MFALAAIILGLYLALFGPDLPYRVDESQKSPLDSQLFRDLLSTLTQSELMGGNTFEVLVNGDNFYPAELAEIRRAQRTINLEAYIFHRSKIGEQFVAALTERARVGVQVKIVLDYIGCFSTSKKLFQGVRSRRWTSRVVSQPASGLTAAGE